MLSISSVKAGCFHNNPKRERGILGDYCPSLTGLFRVVMNPFALRQNSLFGTAANILEKTFRLIHRPISINGFRRHSSLMRIEHDLKLLKNPKAAGSSRRTNCHRTIVQKAME
jgi:hypothetical protein